MRLYSDDNRAIAPYGTWTSPITAETLSAKGLSFLELGVHGPTGKLYLLEGRPAEDGRCCIVECMGKDYRDVLPRKYSARTAVHEYGGAAFTVGSDGDIVFSDWDTKCVFTLSPASGRVCPILEFDPDVYYADFCIHPHECRWILAIREDHHPSVVENSIVVIDSLAKSTRSIASGADFYSHPQFSPDGKCICWMQWNHPDMPWTGTILQTAQWHEGTISQVRFVAGEAGTESISQPRWLSDGSLMYASDRTGFWQLYRLGRGQSHARHVQLKQLAEVEFAGPEWWLGNCTYTGLSECKLVATYTKDGAEHLVIVDLESESHEDLQLPIIDIRDNAIRRVSDTTFAVIGSALKSPTALYLVDISDLSNLAVLKSSSTQAVPRAFYSSAQHISFPRRYGADLTGESHALFLPPQNPHHAAPPNTLPPLIVSLHGGPTFHDSSGLSLLWQYYTTRGYAFASVNYAGSSGYGRAYRERLNGHWGVADVADAASCVEYLASTARIDPARVGVVGGSAGGYATLQSLCTFPDIWACGVSQYGVSDMCTLEQTTHKFESRYIRELLLRKGAGEAERKKVYRERSPLFHAQRIRAPLLLLQGTEDRVVPPEQASEMERVVREGGGDVRLVFFEGEGHGFRRRGSVKRAIVEQELWWVKTLLRGVEW